MIRPGAPQPKNRVYSCSAGTPTRSSAASARHNARYTPSAAGAAAYSANNCRRRVGHGHGPGQTAHVHKGRAGTCSVAADDHPPTPPCAASTRTCPPPSIPCRCSSRCACMRFDQVLSTASAAFGNGHIQRWEPSPWCKSSSPGRKTLTATTGPRSTRSRASRTPGSTAAANAALVAASPRPRLPAQPAQPDAPHKATARGTARSASAATATTGRGPAGVRSISDAPQPVPRRLAHDRS